MTNVAQSKTARTRRRPTKKKAAPTQPSTSTASSSEGEEDLEQTQPSSISASWSASKQTPARRGGRGGAGSKRAGAGKYDNSKKQKKKLARHASTDYSPRSQLKAAKRVSKESYPGMNVDYDQKQLPFLPILGLDDDKVPVLL